MRILVTGGAGFIGSHFIRSVLQKHPEYEVINLDKLTYAGDLERLVDLEEDPRYTFVQGDICDPSTVAEAAQGVEALVNFAAATHVDRSILDAGDFVQTNVYGTYVLLEAARTLQIPRYLQVSTDETYGSIQAGAFRESDPLNPSSPYAASKAGADLLALSYWTTHKLPVIVTRGSNTFGPYQYPEKLIPLFITNALEEKPLPLYGDGQNVRDWLYVLDHCEALDLVLHEGKGGEVYNIGGGNERTNREITGLILEGLEKPKSLIRFVTDRPGHDRRYALDCSKLRALGFAPRHPFEEALQETIRWYQANRRWWERIRGEAFDAYYRRVYGGEGNEHGGVHPSLQTGGRTPDPDVV